MHNNRRKKHTLRNLGMWFVLLFILGGAAFGMTRYRSVKSAANSSFAPSGIIKQRDVNSELKNKKPISILLMGIDTNSSVKNYQGNTNSMMVLTLNPDTQKTTITSIPRDIAVKKINGSNSDKAATISSAYSVNGTRTAITTVEKLLNVPVDFYALVNMGGMSKAINKAGGVDVTPETSFSFGGYTFTKGVKTHMDGNKAMAYVRSRANDDTTRQSRQRQVLIGLVSQSKSIATLFNQDLIDSVTDQVQTDLTFDQMTTLAKNYSSVGKTTTDDSLKGTAAEVNGQSMETVKNSELQRVTDSIRDNLGLEKATTGNIEYVVTSNANY